MLHDSFGVVAGASTSRRCHQLSAPRLRPPGVGGCPNATPIQLRSDHHGCRVNISAIQLHQRMQTRARFSNALQLTKTETVRDLKQKNTMSRLLSILIKKLVELIEKHQLQVAATGSLAFKADYRDSSLAGWLAG